MEIKKVLLKETFADPDFNCRGSITPSDVETLKLSISKNGLEQPIVVQPYAHGNYLWKVVSGHRRHKACELLGYSEIPAIIKDNLDEFQARTLNLIENLERRDLTILQEARAINHFAEKGYTLEEIGKMINKSITWVQIRLAALTLPSDIQERIGEGLITQEQIRDICRIPSLEGRYEAVRLIIDARMAGDKSRIDLKVARRAKKKDPNEKRIRSVTEMNEMQDFVIATIGYNLATRILGWTSGLVSTEEIHDEIRKSKMSA